MATLSERVLTTRSMHKEFGEVRPYVVFELCERTDRQIDKQIDILITILCALPGQGQF